MNTFFVAFTHRTARCLRWARGHTAGLAIGLCALLPLAAHAAGIPPGGPGHLDVPRLSVALPPSAAHVPPSPPSIRVPPVPPAIQVPAGNEPFRVGHAFGTQQYFCVLQGTDFVWKLFGPQATLLNDDDRQIITHFLSPDPSDTNKPHPTWEDSRDTSVVWGTKIAESGDANFVAPGAIKWFLLQAAGSQSGPTGGEAMTRTTYIQRLSTSGGAAPSGTCDPATNNMVLVPYTADYYFYRAAQ